MQNTVIGVYDNYSQAQAALSELIARGFNRSNIQMSPEQETFEARKSALSTSDRDEGWSIGNFFRSLFGSDEDSASHSDVYHEAVRRGSYMVTVQADSEAQRDQASEILNRFSPVDIDERSSQWRTQGWSKYDRNTAPFTDEEITRERGLYGSTASAGAAGAASTSGTTGKATATSKAATARAAKADKTSGETRLPVIEEELKIGKRAVQRGGVRIYQHVTERPVEETVRLRDEKVNVSRRPVNQPASEADLAAFKEGSMELRETTEEPVVSKTARVVEEVSINKEVREHDETVRDNVRRTDVDVEQLGAGGTTRNAGAFDSNYYRSHWQNSFASQGGRYEDYEPAYRFGNDLRSNQTYRGRSWNDMEPEVRRDWESRHAGSPWERAKDAVRHAWEKIPG